MVEEIGDELPHSIPPPPQIDAGFIRNCGTKCGRNDYCPVYRKDLTLKCMKLDEYESEGRRLRLVDTKTIGVYEVVEDGEE